MLQEDQLDSPPYTQLTVESNDLQLVTGTALYLNQFRSMLKKKYLTNLRNPLSFFFQFFAPTLFLGYVLYSQRSQLANNAPLELSLNEYGGQVVSLLAAHKNADMALVERYENSINRTGTLITVPDIKSYIWGMSDMDYNDFKYRSVIGADFADNHILAMFSGEPYHSIPISLTAIYNAIVRKNPDAPELLFVNHPVPVRLSETENQLQEFASYYVVALLLSFGILSTSSDLCEIYVTERQSGVMNMQFISGLSPDLYWIFSLAADLVVYGLSVATVILVAGLTHSTKGLWEFYQILFLFGLAALPFGYLRARRFKKPADLGSDLRKFGYLGILVYALIMGAITMGKVKKEDVEMYFMLLPHINLFDGVIKYTMAIAGLVSARWTG